jgi:hypothetical protein
MRSGDGPWECHLLPGNGSFPGASASHSNDINSFRRRNAFLQSTCQRGGRLLKAPMEVGPLTGMAIALNPRAARIAALLLATEPLLPAELRSALQTALIQGDPDADGTPASSLAPQDLEAAHRFVDACRAACAR